ncbi:hypothetical protein N7468_005030 [Penicillium chermesinum]|uniref:SprT-like domain-containing protein n=1 Tax=Penicillium chermesinum TaxID=63820 RepID=A0A9W9TPA5_9EURO|nr:uncharacterized protein N7468_005030 [Penicillium chermesinum]KAJ5232074.1 hypothetical protein N7468_005030 [Penicillium chermesinum]
MARLNTTSNRTQGEPRQRTGLKEPSVHQQGSFGTEKLVKDRSSKGPSHKKKKSSGAFFDIFPDTEQTHDQDDGDDGDPTSSSLPSRKQKTTRTLKAAPVNSLLLPLQRRRRQRPNTKAGTDDYDKENDLTEDTMDSYSVDPSPQPSPRRFEQTPERSRLQDRPRSRMSPESRGSEREDSDADTSFNSLDDFIVSDNDEISYQETSGSDSEDPKIRSPSPAGDRDLGLGSNGDEKSSSSSVSNPRQVSQDDIQLLTKLNKIALEDNPEGLEGQDDTSSGLETTRSTSVTELDSPTTFQPARKDEQTPPSSPSPSGRLRSPKKEKSRIPPTPHRESMDAFWSQEETNNWNDKHSPQKPKSDRLMLALLQEFDNSDDEGSSQDSGSGLEPIPKSPVKSTEPKTPSKTALKKAEAEAKRAEKALRQEFDNKKEALAKSFLHDLDVAVTGGKIIQLAEETGGVEIVWSKTLQKTAGRATWRASQRQGNLPLHYAKIELADRILVDEYRLTNTLAHEYCHLANYMISKVVDQPHGPSFKAWGQKCATAMKDHPEYGGKIHVTTKHSYKIDYKYVWACVNCGCQFGRHSKSLDTTRFSCGTCKGKLEQIKPKPRNVSPKKSGAIPPNFQKKSMEYVKLSLDELKL